MRPNSACEAGDGWGTRRTKPSNRQKPNKAVIEKCTGGKAASTKALRVARRVTREWSNNSTSERNLCSLARRKVVQRRSSLVSKAVRRDCGFWLGLENVSKRRDSRYWRRIWRRLESDRIDCKRRMLASSVVRAERRLICLVCKTETAVVAKVAKRMPVMGIKAPVMRAVDGACRDRSGDRGGSATYEMRNEKTESGRSIYREETWR